MTEGAAPAGEWAQPEAVLPAVVGKPVQPGQVLNPTGKNQYTYRTAWNRAMNAALLAQGSGVKNQTVIDDLVDALLTEAKAARPWAMKLVMARVWPEVVRHEVDHSNAPPPVSPLENLNDEDRTTMLRLAQKAIRGGDTNQ